MRFIYLLLFLSLLSTFSTAQERITFAGDIQAVGISKDDLVKQLNGWFDGFQTFKDLLNNKEDTITGKGHFPYRNSVEIEGSTLESKEYSDKINGLFTYTIKFYVKENGYRYVFSDFTHWPTDRNDNINFGVITNQEKVPAEARCEFDPDWCSSVWASMKQFTNTRAPLIIGTLPYRTK